MHATLVSTLHLPDYLRQDYVTDILKPETGSVQRSHDCEVKNVWGNQVNEHQKSKYVNKR